MLVIYFFTKIIVLLRKGRIFCFYRSEVMINCYNCCCTCVSTSACCTQARTCRHIMWSQTNYFKRSFSKSEALLRNKLPHELRNAGSTGQFKPKSTKSLISYIGFTQGSHLKQHLSSFALLTWFYRDYIMIMKVFITECYVSCNLLLLFCLF